MPTARWSMHKGQKKLFDDNRYFFFITNDFRKSAATIVLEANHRCNQENLFAQAAGPAGTCPQPEFGCSDPHSPLTARRAAENAMKPQTTRNSTTARKGTRGDGLASPASPQLTPKRLAID